MESPFQSYSFTMLRRLLDVILQLRRVKALVSDSNSDLRDLIAEIGVPFAHFSDELDKLNDEAITLTDLLRICGHPLALSKDASGNTPLHYAAEAGYLPLCELFVSNGAKINAQNKSGETPYVRRHIIRITHLTCLVNAVYTLQSQVSDLKCVSISFSPVPTSVSAVMFS